MNFSFDNYNTEGFFDEMFLPDGSIREGYSPFKERVEQLPSEEFIRRQQAAERHYRIVSGTAGCRGRRTLPVHGRTGHYCGHAAGRTSVAAHVAGRDWPDWPGYRAVVVACGQRAQRRHR